MATAITEWIPKIATAAPLCPMQTLKEMIIETCRDFCHQTQLWNNNALTAIDIVDETADYDLASLSGDIVTVDAVQVNGKTATYTTIEELDRLLPYWRDQEAVDPAWYVFGMADSIKLVYTPSADETAGLEVWVTLKPLESATTVQDFLYRDYKDTIAMGAKGLLMQIDDMPWTDTAKGAAFFAAYENARDTAKIKRFTGRTGKPINALAQAPFFA